MKIDTKTVISMTEANQNFSKVTRLVDQYGQAVIFKNNVPRYLVIDFSLAERAEEAADESILALSNMIMDKYDDAFMELAK